MLSPPVDANQPNASMAIDEVERIQTVADQTVFEVTKAEGSEFTVQVETAGVKRGELDMVLSADHPVRLECAGRRPASGADGDFLAELASYLGRRSWVTAWFSSGHTLVDGLITRSRFADVPFAGYRFSDFSAFDVRREKPDPLSRVGESNSLFCWVKTRFVAEFGSGADSGWLACDEGAGEICDFIHYDTQTSPPVLSLIHVKVSKNANPGRPIAVSDYEVVTSQAVKNLRNLWADEMSIGLTEGVKEKISSLVWCDGASSSRNAMADAIGATGANYERRVVIVQPRLTSAKEESERLNEGRLLKLLNTLLNGTAGNCSSWVRS